MDENDLDAASTCLRSTGFVLLPGFFPTELLKVLEAEALDLVSDARSGSVQSVRIYDDFPKIFGGLNISGVEHPLPYLSELSLWLQTNTLSDLVGQLVGGPVRCGLIRLHTNNRFKWRGFWHKDAEQVDRSIVSVLYLRQEMGFRLLGKNLPIEKIEQGSFVRHSEETIVSARAGDVLLFDASLWHRGHSNGPRLHVHLRFDQVGVDEAIRMDWESHLRILEGASTSGTRRNPRVIQWLKLAAYLLPGRHRSSIFQGR